MENYIGKICPFCKTEIAETDAVKVCPACGIAHHEGCWNENGGCTTFGCSGQEQTGPKSFCSNCGAPMEAEEAFCGKCGTPKAAAAPKKNVCGNCGAELQDGQGFCPKCGYKAGVEVDNNLNAAISAFNAGVEQQTKKKKALPFIILGAVAAVIIAICAFLFSGPSVEKITLSKTYVEMKVGDSISVDYTIAPEKASDTEVTWKSSDTSVATVSSTGKIIGKSAGSCTITATAGGKSAKISVQIVTMYPEEKQAVGTWSSIGYMDEDDDYVPLYSSTSKFYVYNDFTGKLTIGSTSYKFTWEYDRYSKEIYYYDAVMSDGSKFEFVIMELGNEDSIVALIGSIKVVFQK